MSTSFFDKLKLLDVEKEQIASLNNKNFIFEGPFKYFGDCIACSTMRNKHDANDMITTNDVIEIGHAVPKPKQRTRQARSKKETKPSPPESGSTTLLPSSSLFPVTSTPMPASVASSSCSSSSSCPSCSSSSSSSSQSSSSSSSSCSSSSSLSTSTSSSVSPSSSSSLSAASSNLSSTSAFASGTSSVQVQAPHNPTGIVVFVLVQLSERTRTYFVLTYTEGEIKRLKRNSVTKIGHNDHGCETEGLKVALATFIVSTLPQTLQSASRYAFTKQQHQNETLQEKLQEYKNKFDSTQAQVKALEKEVKTPKKGPRVTKLHEKLADSETQVRQLQIELDQEKEKEKEMATELERQREKEKENEKKSRRESSRDRRSTSRSRSRSRSRHSRSRSRSSSQSPSTSASSPSSPKNGQHRRRHHHDHHRRYPHHHRRHDRHSRRAHGGPRSSFVPSGSSSSMIHFHPCTDDHNSRRDSSDD
eukprot:TRINITY_DN245_c0_g1_i11.p1 TRINITY_DN245_c0_g1~~TRINITY_DN245_c0_g1_i11.p1  ORF type:complete len:475 (-),score=131.13 TRINITY_DN245_c0_g1_i11:1727-3151(-)